VPQITLDAGDAAGLAGMLTFLASWLSGSQKQILTDSFAAFAGHPAYNTGNLCADPPVRLPPRRKRRRRTLRQAGAMTADTGAARSLDKITRITPSLSGSPPRCRGSGEASRSTFRCVLSPAGKEEKVIKAGLARADQRAPRVAGRPSGQADQPVMAPARARCFSS
jgi:hypothetical protein